MIDPLAPLVQLLNVAAVVCGAWLGVLTALAVVGRVPGAVGRAAQVIARRAAPVALHGLLGLTVGAGALSAPAVAAEHPAPPPVSLDWPGTTAPTGATATPAPSVTSAPATPAPSVTSRPAAPPAPAVTSVPAAPPGPTAPPLAPPAAAPPAAVGEPRVVVRPGDSLWGVAARALGEAATPARVAQEWPRWWAANRDVIGDDPDLIHPGTVLDRPARAQETS